MKIIYRIIMIPLFTILFLVGCKNDDTRDLKAAPPKNQPLQKDMVLNSISMRKHLENIQTIAMSNQNNRAVGTKGAQETAEYILQLANKAGFKTTTMTFNNEELQEGKNILVDIPGKLNNAVILVGAHYDSVPDGPGINDNASGVSVLLEFMNQLSLLKEPPKYTIRLAFWDSEETGAVGSKNYVSKLNTAQLQEIKTYINLDMVGTGSPTATVIDADKTSQTALATKLRNEKKSEEEIAEEIQKVLAIPSLPEDLQYEVVMKTFYQSKKQPFYEDLTLIPSTDTRAFAGKVPVAAIEMLNENNGTDRFAPCYHRICDTIDLIDSRTLELSGQALIHLIQTIEKK
ncbi:hypothetical protein B9T31_08370 [Acinetobacter sp. ANC 4558]|nr:hypothetical protein B9T31_08370 [Acinetobacter sp. ANC 4558]